MLNRRKFIHHTLTLSASAVVGGASGFTFDNPYLSFDVHITYCFGEALISRIAGHSFSKERSGAHDSPGLPAVQLALRR